VGWVKLGDQFHAVFFRNGARSGHSLCDFLYSCATVDKISTELSLLCCRCFQDSPSQTIRTRYFSWSLLSYAARELIAVLLVLNVLWKWRSIN